MTSKQGYRLYFQVLLEENRGKMFVAEAKRNNKKPAAFMREIIYDYLERTQDNAAYQNAVIEDQKLYQNGVNSRLIGRWLSKNRGLPPKPVDNKG